MAQGEVLTGASPFLGDSSAKSSKRRHATENISLRLDSGLKQVLVQEAKKRRINLNTIASQILASYANWGRYAEELHLIPFNNEVLRELFQALSTETLENISKRAGETNAHQEIVFLFKRISIETVIRFIELRSSHFPASHHWIESGTHHFTLQHDLGHNFSIFVKGYFSSMVRSTIGGSLESIDVSPNSITYRITV